MRRAMDLIHYVVKDGVLESSNDRSLSRQVSTLTPLCHRDLEQFLSISKQQTIEWDAERNTAFTCLKHFSRLVEMARPRFDRAPASSMGASNPVSSATGGGGSSSATAQGTGECVAKHLHIMKWENWDFTSLSHAFFLSFLSLILQTNKKNLYIVNVNAIDKDVVGAERRDRERELMRSNSERDRSTTSMGREFNDHHQNQRDVSLAKYSCRGEVNTLIKKIFCHHCQTYTRFHERAKKIF